MFVHSLWEIGSFHLIVLTSPLMNHSSIAFRAYLFHRGFKSPMMPRSVLSVASHASLQIQARLKSTAVASILVIVLFGQNFDPVALVPS